jgi:hypothetical protein
MGVPERRSRLPAPRTLVILGVLVLLLSAPWWIARHNRLKAENVAEPIAQRLTNRDIDVKCPGLFGLILFETNEGSVQFDADGVPLSEAKLSKRTCAGLRTVASHAPELDFGCLAASACDHDTEHAAEALAVLTHEIMHLLGAIDEGQTECQARGRVQDVAIQARIQPEMAAALSTWQAGPWQQRLPERYRNASC